MKLTQSLEPELKVQMELDAHEKECAVRYQMMNDKLESVDKRLWRLEAMIMASTVTIIGLASTVLVGVG
jgi:hypothetical protein